MEQGELSASQGSAWRDWDLLRGLETPTMEGIHPRALIRAPRCLRRNSSHLLPADAVYQSRTSYGLYGRYRRASQARRPSLTPNSSGRWQGKAVGLGAPRTGRRGSASLQKRNDCLACWRDSLSHLQSPYYDPHVDTWSGFLSYVDHYVCPGCRQPPAANLPLYVHMCVH